MALKENPLDPVNLNERLKKLSEGWEYVEELGTLRKEFGFKGYLKTISFVNAIAWQANSLMHHPDLEVSFNKCLVKITTHDSGNTITEKDFALAEAIDQLGN